MMRKIFSILFLFLLLFGITGIAQATVWGVDPTAGNQIVEIDPFSGAIVSSFSDPTGVINSGDTEIGLAGWSNNTLFLTDADSANGVIYNLNSVTGNSISDYSVSAGWEIDGIGYYSDATGSWIYTSGCSVDDMHRYDAVDGASPTYYWSNIYDPRAVAGDNGGKIFSYGEVGDTWGIYEINPLADTDATFFASSPSDDIVGMAYDGNYLYLSGLDGYLYTMNNAGDTVASINFGSTLYALGSTEGINNESVPEPATMLLLGSSIVGLSAFRKKFKKS